MANNETIDDKFLHAVMEYIDNTNDDKILKDIQEFINAGANVNYQSSNGTTAIVEAAGYGTPELVKLLLAAGADVNLSDGENTALTKVLRFESHPNIEIVKILINAGADPNEHNGEPLFWATESNNIELLNILISAGADVNIELLDGFSDLPSKSSQLMFASSIGRIEIVRLLLIEGADVNLKNEDGKKAIDYAIPQSIISDLLKNPSASIMMGKKNRGVVYIPDNNKTNSIAFDDITNGETVVRIQQFGKDFFYRLESWKEFMNNELKNYPRRLIKNPINRAIVTADQIDIFTAHVVAADLNSSVVGSKRPRPANLRGGTRRRRSTRRAKKRVTRRRI